MKKASGKLTKLTHADSLEIRMFWGYGYWYSVDKFLERGNDEFSIDVLAYQKVAPLDAVLHKTMRGPAGVSILLSLVLQRSTSTQYSFLPTAGQEW